MFGKLIILIVSIVSMSAIYATANSNSTLKANINKVDLESMNNRFHFRDQFREKGNSPITLKHH